MRARAPIAGAVVAALAAGGAGSRDGTDAPGIDVEGLHPAAFRGAAQQETPRGRWLTARIRRPARLLARPGGRTLARLTVRTEFGSPQVLGVLARRGGWLRVLSPQLPNGRSGWVRSSRVELAATDVAITVDRSRRRLELRDGRRLLGRFRVGVGRAGSPSPLGRFAVTDRLHMPPGSPYGCCALALTGHQPHLPSGWHGGDRLAIHGTVDPGSFGRAASLGCIRAPRRGLRVMMRRVPLGAPVFVHR
jgi:L,D-transpeptidase catalytic domain